MTEPMDDVELTLSKEIEHFRNELDAIAAALGMQDTDEDMAAEIRKRWAETERLNAALTAQEEWNDTLDAAVKEQDERHAAVIAAEREACAKIAESRIAVGKWHPQWNDACEYIALVIRARTG